MARSLPETWNPRSKDTSKAPISTRLWKRAERLCTKRARKIGSARESRISKVATRTMTTTRAQIAAQNHRLCLRPREDGEAGEDGKVSGVSATTSPFVIAD